VLRHHIYYALKPYLPWRMRMAVRRISATRKRKQCGQLWPIDEASAQPPPGWKGWPQGRQFAVILTHDVEGPEGLAKCRKLAELEMKLGFRSSFNFIPEGSYTVPADLRHWLVSNGFEVGVHDLRHDGRLYDSSRAFTRNATQINRYLKDWGAVGFRSGFMMRNLAWIHQLDVQYDSSTFDTDPFEPQSNGTRIIFPFWIPRPSGDRPNGNATPSWAGMAREGYVELPYTLPQDSTLFLLLRENSPEIWRSKTEWIAARGGMALLNVHPDYIDFDGDQQSVRTYPAEWYRGFLEHLGERHRGSFVNLLPREAAHHYRPAGRSGTLKKDGPNLRGHQAAVLLYSHFPSDPRPRRAAETMVAAGMNVDLLCLTERDGEPLQETIGGVRVFRVPMKHKRGSKASYLWQYSRFILRAFWFLAHRSINSRYDVVHVHNMPDVLVFAALVPKLQGAKVILDLHDPMPELMTSIFGAKPQSTGISILKLLERWSLGFADRILTVNEACRKIFSARSCPAEKIQVIMNSPDETIFELRPPPAMADAAPESGRPFVIMYHGSIVERHGLDLAVEAVASLRASIPGIRLRIYGQRTAFLEKVLTQVAESHLGDVVSYEGPQSLESIVQAIRECDVGIIPNRRSIFTEINTPTRIFEYLSQGKPVIAPRAPGIQDYFGPDDLVYFELGDGQDLASKIAYVHDEPAKIDATIRRGQRTYLAHTWSSERQRFVSLVEEIVAPEPLPDPDPIDSDSQLSGVSR